MHSDGHHRVTAQPSGYFEIEVLPAARTTTIGGGGGGVNSGGNRGGNGGHLQSVAGAGGRLHVYSPTATTAGKNANDIVHLSILNARIFIALSFDFFCSNPDPTHLMIGTVV